MLILTSLLWTDNETKSVKTRSQKNQTQKKNKNAIK